MSSIAPSYDVARVFEDENIRFRSGAAGAAWKGLVGLGALLTVGAALGGFTGEAEKAVALHALHTGFLLVLSFTLGALGFYMICTAVKAGWWVMLRKQFENVFTLMWLPGVLFLLVMVLQAVYVNTSEPTQIIKVDGEYVKESAPFVWNWMDPQYRAGDPLYDHKAPYLNVPFFWARALVCFAIWIGLARVLSGLSDKQDATGDKWLSRTIGKVAVGGLPFLAFSIAFASFDWVMTLDYHWFSTMFGVYYFAGSTVGFIALLIVMLSLISGVGKMRAGYTVEHRHDLGKLLFAFVVFWGYITFSQYFLIWYANIPEETAWYTVRKDTWEWLSWTLPIAHFIVPFLVLIPKPARRSPVVLTAVAVWMLALHVLDVFWNVRPEVPGAYTIHWLDVLGVLGPVALFAGLLIRNVVSKPLMPLHEPRQAEGLDHKNYV
jgi:hypothetical protein